MQIRAESILWKQDRPSDELLMRSRVLVENLKFFLVAGGIRTSGANPIFKMLRYQERHARNNRRVQRSPFQSLPDKHHSRQNLNTVTLPNCNSCPRSEVQIERFQERGKGCVWPSPMLRSVQLIQLDRAPVTSHLCCGAANHVLDCSAYYPSHRKRSPVLCIRSMVFHLKRK